MRKETARHGVMVIRLLAVTLIVMSPAQQAPAQQLPAQQAPVQQVPSQRLPEPGEISLPHSHVYIHVGKVGLGHEHAVVGSLQHGTLHLGRSQDAGVLVFDMASFVADTAEARKYLALKGETSTSTQAQVNANLRGAEVLDVERYPTAIYQIASAQPIQVPAGEPAKYDLRGEFTLHGTTRPLRIFVTLPEEKNGFQHVRCGFAIRQSDFGIKPYTKALGAVGVADELKIYGDAWLRKESRVAQTPTDPTR